MVLGFQPLETNIDAVCTLIDFRRYRLANGVAYIDPDVDLSLHLVKRKVKILYPTLEPFYAKDPMEIICFVSPMAKAFDCQRQNEEVASRSLGLFLT